MDDGTRDLVNAIQAVVLCEAAVERAGTNLEDAQKRLDAAFNENFPTANSGDTAAIAGRLYRVHIEYDIGSGVTLTPVNIIQPRREADHAVER